MIDLGLSRSHALLNALGSPQNYFKAFHVAGTNGKGSVVSYLSSIFVSAGINTGKFTSPHLISENDAICINNVPVSMEKYQQVGAYIRQLDHKFGIGATEFETQTAIAFEIFRLSKVKYAVVEVGLGGLLDATNVLSVPNVACTAITKISMDHEHFLGTNLAEIARQKAGIIKPRVNCVVDATNSTPVKDAISEYAQLQDAPVIFVDTLPSKLDGFIAADDLLLGDFQVQNAAVATQVALLAEIPAATIAKGLKSTVWKGRLDWMDFKGSKILVDGAHNTGSATELAKYAHANIQGPITWVMAFSKPCQEILPVLIRPQDTVVATRFGKVDGMPWVSAQAPGNIAKVARSITDKVETFDSVGDVKLETRGNVVVAGSLYLLREILGTVK